MAKSSKRIDDYLETQIARGSFPGAQYAVGEGGQLTREGALGFAVVEPEPIAATVDTIYDIASLTKPLVTSLLAVILCGLGAIDLNAPLGDYLSEFNDKRKRQITLIQLMTHVSGLPNWRPLYLETSEPEQAPAYIASLVEDATSRKAAPVVYSDLNYIALAYALERATGERLDRLAQKHIFDPLGLKRTMFTPPPELKREIAATERGQVFERANAISDAQSRADRAAGGSADISADSMPANSTSADSISSDSTSSIYYISEPLRAGVAEPSSLRWREDMIWGEVHDGNAHYLRGIAGHAGVFSVAREVFQIANQFLRGSSLVSEDRLRMFTENMTCGQETARSISWILASSKDCSAGAALPPTAMGHTGFTGTSVWMDPARRRVCVLLTNRIHPRVSAFDMKEVRQQFNTLAVEEMDES
jgi:serine-type D-Ala-D-Ala carboxypeptidase